MVPLILGNPHIPPNPKGCGLDLWLQSEQGGGINVPSIIGVDRGYVGIMEKKMEATIMGSIWGLGFRI